MLVSASYKVKLFAEIFFINSNLDDLRIFLPIFLSRTNLRLYSICVTPMLGKKVVIDLVSSGESGPDFIPVMVLNKYESGLSQILADLFNNYLKQYCFRDCWKISSVIPLFKNAGKSFCSQQNLCKSYQ